MDLVSYCFIKGTKKLGLISFISIESVTDRPFDEIGLAHMSFNGNPCIDVLIDVIAGTCS